MSWWRRFAKRAEMEQHLDAELRFHFDGLVADNLRAGMSEAEARRSARLEFGGLEQVKEECRDARGTQFVDALLRDVRDALRILRKNPGSTAVAILMLALGIGVNAAVFTVVNAALFEGWPLVYRHDRITQISTAVNGMGRGAPLLDFKEWESQAKSFEGVALVRGVSVALSDGGGIPDTYFTAQVSVNTFQLLGVKPILGRDFTPADEQPGVVPVVLLSYEMWVNRFEANKAIVGRTVRIDGLPTSVIGVMPKGFSIPDYQFDLCVPLTPPLGALTAEVPWGGGFAFARLADGVTIDRARAEVETLGRRLATAYPRTNKDLVPVVKSFSEWFVGADARTLYKSLWGAVGFVLLIVCANVANLLVAQAIGRSHEISIRLALGAGRWRIIRQFLVESLILSSVGGGIGWWIARAGVRIYALAQSKANMLTLTMDHGVLVYFIAISGGTGLLAALAAATYLTKLNITNTSKGDRSGVTQGKRGKHLSGLFVGVETVLAVVLIASAGVLSRSLLKVYTANLGVNIQNVLTTDLYTPPERFNSPEARLSFYREIGTRLRALPGVESVSFGALPTDRELRIPYELADASSVDEHSRPIAAEIVVSQGYFRTLEAKLISGREFNDFDGASSIPVAIVNQQFASRNWPGEVPLGKRLRLFAPWKKSAPWLTVVGVVSNIVQNDRTRQAFEPLVYLPDGQNAPGGSTLVRTSVAPGRLAAAVRREIYTVDHNLRVPGIWPLTERLDRAYAFERNITDLFLFFAVIALFLALIGLYATVSNSVSRRIQEIGIRVAIGAAGRDVVRLVFTQAMAPVGIGLALGLAASFAVNRVLKSQLVGVSPADPVTLVAASALLVFSAALACLIPARRATRIDPAEALRWE